MSVQYRQGDVLLIKVSEAEASTLRIRERARPSDGSFTTYHHERNRMNVRSGMAAVVFVAALVLAGCASSTVPEIRRVDAISEFGDIWGWSQTQGRVRRDRIHVGVDYREQVGAPVLAAADGVMHQFSNPECGLGVRIMHSNASKTVYCHFQEYAVKQYGVTVKRGDVIGRVGLTGTSGGIPHVHLEYWIGTPHLGNGSILPEGALDPHSVMAGCFEPGRKYPTDKFVLTYPVKCRGN